MHDDQHESTLDELLCRLAGGHGDDEQLLPECDEEPDRDDAEPEAEPDGATHGDARDVDTADGVADEGLFFRRLGQVALLSKDEEQRLAKQIELIDKPGATAAQRAAGKLAYEQMVEANLRLVVWIARRFQGHGVDLSDLIQEGALGLMHAARKFDWRRGFKFSTYATWWITQHVQRAIADSGRTIRIPVHLVSRLAAAQQLAREAEAAGKPLTLAALAAELGTSAEELAHLQLMATGTVSLSTPLDRDGDDELGDLLADERIAVEREVQQRALAQLVSTAMVSLTTPERLALTHRFGLDGEPPRTLEATAKILQCSRLRVRQLERAALRTLEREGALVELYRVSGRDPAASS